MASVTIDIIDGESGKFTRRGWEERNRVAMVRGITGTGHQKLSLAIDALQATPANRAQFGDEHPTAPQVFLEELNPEAVSSTVVRIRMIYRYPSFPDDGTNDSVIEVGASIIQQTVNTDSDGELMTVEYNGQKQSGSVSIPVPQSTARYQRRLAYSPGALARQYVGKVNEGGWFVDPGADERTWLCTRIVGTSEDRAATFLTTFEFSFLEEGYDAKVVYIDPETGRMPDDIVDGTGIRTFQVINSEDFNGIPT